MAMTSPPNGNSDQGPDYDSPVSPISSVDSKKGNWLRGGGEMGSAIRAFDWANTALGPIDEWPQSLRIALSLCLNSRFPMFLWWGPALVNLHNDAYLPILGQRRRDALGRPARELWSEVWREVGPQVDAVFEKGEASWHEQVRLVVTRNGYEEDAYFTYSHSPVFDDQGQVGGLICVVSEITARVLSEQRQAFLLGLSDRLRTLGDSQTIKNVAVETLGRHLRANRVGYGAVQPDGMTVAVESIYVDGVQPINGNFSMDSFGAETVARQRQGITVAKEDTIADSGGDPRIWAAIETRSYVSVPLVRDGQLLATFYVSQRIPRRWSPEEVTLIEEVASRTWDAVQRAQAEQALRASEARLKAVLDSVPVGIVMAEMPSGRIVLGNPQIGRILRHPVIHTQGIEEYNEWPLLDAAQNLVPADQYPIARALRSGEPAVGEYLYRRGDNTLAWIDVSSAPVRDDSGNVEGAVVAVADITERKQTEEARRKAEERLSFALDAGGGVGAWDWDLPGDRVYVNARFAELYSIDPAHAKIGASIWEFVASVHPEDRDLVAARIQQAIQFGGDYAAEYRIVQKDGSVRWVYARGRCHLDANGAPNRFPGVVYDVTDRKQAEGALRESEARFRELANAVPAFVWTTDSAGSLTYFNDRWYAYTGLTPEQSLGSGWVSSMPKEDAERILPIWEEARKHGTPYQVECRYRSAQGVDRWFLVRALPVRNAEGSIIQWFGTSTDVHEAKLAAEALHKANRELEEFAYVASHDLQEPLRMVNIYTELLLRDFVPDHGEAREFAGFISQGVKRMQQLIKDLLDFSRTIQHEGHHASGAADLSASLFEAVSLLQNRIEESGALIKSSPLPRVVGDAHQLAHVFQNLLSNSLKYRHPRRKPEIRITAKRHGANWLVKVRDNGIGFEQEYAARIFGLFKRLHKDEYPGTGLGLAICQRIVERYGGRMWAEGRPGDGSTFYFQLPAAAAEGVEVSS